MNGFKKHFPTMEFLLLLLLTLPLVTLNAMNISGKVTDTTSTTPMAGVKVVLINSLQEAITDARGVYQFLNVPPGQYNVQVELPLNYVAASMNPMVVTVSHSDVKANFSLGIPGHITGRVVDSNTNLPIANANVDVMRGNHLISSTLTDENGEYMISGLAPRPYIVRVRMPYFQSSLQLAIPISNQTIIIDFALQCPPGKIIGHIVDVVSGRPIANATLDLLEKGVIVDSAQTDKDGRYFVSEVAPKSYQIRATASHFHTTIQDIVLLKNQTLMVNFALEPVGTVVGQVIHAFTGEPIANASIGLWQNNALIGATHSDKNGYFNIEGLGLCQLVVQAYRFHDLVKEVHIPSLQTETLNFSLVCLEPTPPTKVSVRVKYRLFAHQINRIHVIKWKPSRDRSVLSYRIYRNGKAIGEVAADDILAFEDEWRSENAITYEVSAINQFGQESLSKSLLIE